MPDKWDQYARPVTATDKWDEYASPMSLNPGTPGSEPVGRFVSNFVDAVNPVPGLKAIATDPKGLRHGIESNIFAPQVQQLSKAAQAAQGKGEFADMGPIGRVSSAVGYGLAGALPLVGPAAARAGEQIGDGDVAGGLGSGAGLLASMATPELMKGTGRALSRGAEPIAESALGIRNVDRKFGRNPGRAVLDETSGVRPATVMDQAANRIGDLSTQRDAALANSTATVSLRPARDVVENAITRAAAGNSDTSSLHPIREQLNEPRPGFAGDVAPINTPPAGTIGPSGPLRISELQSPMNALAIRQRLGSDFTKFDMARPVTREASSVANRAYGNLTDAIHQAVPESGPLDSRISNLIPVRDAATVKDLAPQTTGQVLGRLGAKTGSLAAGTLAGAHYGNPVAGAVLGAIVPELLSDPTAQMIGARTLDASGKALRSPVLTRAVQGGQLLRPSGQQQ